jgi:coenzyme F420-0:L-glutamate ligase / coenzyme F420-1:gamma-L-glutamate ligase
MPSTETNGAITVLPVTGVGEVQPGEDLAALLAAALRLVPLGDPSAGGSSLRGASPGPRPDETGDGCGADPASPGLHDGDVLVVTQKVVSKAEGRVVAVDTDDRQAVLDLIEHESVRILRRRGDLVITETEHGFVCANAGVDLSNMDEGTAAMLPVDPDRSARRLRESLEHRFGVSVGVIISDTFGRTWRQGVIDVAIGLAGVAGVVDLRGTPDANGRILSSTEVCVADELAAAAELVMGKARRTPAAVIRGVDPAWLRPSSVAAEVIRAPAEDLFR